MSSSLCRALRLALLMILMVGEATHIRIAAAEDGYRLWLRYDAVSGALHDVYAARATTVVTLHIRRWCRPQSQSWMPA